MAGLGRAPGILLGPENVLGGVISLIPLGIMLWWAYHDIRDWIMSKRKQKRGNL